MPNAIPTLQQTAQSVRSVIRPERRVKWVWCPLGILALNYFVFAGSFVAIVAVPNYFVKALCIVVNGHAIGTLFTVGHDACHGSFTCSRWLNKVVGRLAFLPSLTPFTQWRYTHNYLHHSFTNCKDKDFVWRPLAVEEYRRLPWFRRLIERSYRTVPGLPLNWIIENWLRWHLFPNRAARVEMAKWSTPAADLWLVAGWFILESVAVATLTFWLAPQPTALAADILVNVALAVAGPFLIWSTLISYVDLLHHTHPAIRWHRSSKEVAFSDTQLEGTTRIVYPFPLGLIYHNIMEHTAHHVDPAIPMYHLSRAQGDLAAGHPGRIVVEFFSFRYLFRVLRVCKLYDYASHQWVGYDGLPTALAIGSTQRT